MKVFAPISIWDEGLGARRGWFFVWILQRLFSYHSSLRGVYYSFYTIIGIRVHFIQTVLQEQFWPYHGFQLLLKPTIWCAWWPHVQVALSASNICRVLCSRWSISNIHNHEMSSSLSILLHRWCFGLYRLMIEHLFQEVSCIDSNFAGVIPLKTQICSSALLIAVCLDLLMVCSIWLHEKRLDKTFG